MKKKIIVIVSVIVVVIAAYVISWNIFMAKTYNAYLKNMDGEDTIKSGSYLCCIAAKPSFPSFHGNLSVSESMISESGVVKKPTIDLIIYPKLFGGYDITAVINDNKTGMLGDGLEGVSFEIDENGKYADGDELKTFYDEYASQINEALEVSKTVFGISGK